MSKCVCCCIAGLTKISEDWNATEFGTRVISGMRIVFLGACPFFLLGVFYGCQWPLVLLSDAYHVESIPTLVSLLCRTGFTGLETSPFPSLKFRLKSFKTCETGPAQ